MRCFHVDKCLKVRDNPCANLQFVSTCHAVRHTPLVRTIKPLNETPVPGRLSRRIQVGLVALAALHRGQRNYLLTLRPTPDSCDPNPRDGQIPHDRFLARQEIRQFVASLRHLTRFGAITDLGSLEPTMQFSFNHAPVRSSNLGTADQIIGGESITHKECYIPGP